MRLNIQLSVLFFLLFQFLFAIPVTPQSAPEFSYDETTGKGPSNWGKLSPAWAVCGNGKMQSPVSISFNDAVPLPSLGVIKTNYSAAIAASAVHVSHVIKISIEGDGGGLTLAGTYYKLIQFHWHWGTEHAFDYKRYDLELHLVHQTPSNQTAVIGILYKLGHHDKILTKLLPRLSDLTTVPKNIGIIDPTMIHIDRTNYFRYVGSLTAPPCTEGIIWTVVKKISEASKTQVEQLKRLSREAYGSNARPLQPLNGRTINSFHTIHNTF